MDFALAASLAEMRPEFTHHTEIAGTLAYLAPEQGAGAVGRWISGRTCTRWARLVGRDDEVTALGAASEEALASRAAGYW